jgi:hypothetical protein
MENRGWGFSPTLDTGPVFTCIVTGDPRLPEAAYPFLRRKLDRLLRGRLPAVRIVFESELPLAGPSDYPDGGATSAPCQSLPTTPPRSRASPPSAASLAA